MKGHFSRPLVGVVGALCRCVCMRACGLWVATNRALPLICLHRRTRTPTQYCLFCQRPSFDHLRPKSPPLHIRPAPALPLSLALSLIHLLTRLCLSPFPPSLLRRCCHGFPYPCCTNTRTCAQSHAYNTQNTVPKQTTPFRIFTSISHHRHHRPLIIVLPGRPPPLLRLSSPRIVEWCAVRLTAGVCLCACVCVFACLRICVRTRGPPISKHRIGAAEDRQRSIAAPLLLSRRDSKPAD